MTSPRIYLDHHATTPVDPRVLEAMLPWFTERFGNASSRTHDFGWEAEEAVEKARAEVAAALGAQPRDIVFTSGATESDNLAIRGLLAFEKSRGNHVVTVATEHKAVLDPLKALVREGAAEVTFVKPAPSGLVDPDDVARAITGRTVLVSVMQANNEVGTLQPLREIGAACRERGVVFHTDAAQGFGKEPLDVDAMGIGLLSLSAHKCYGPKGVGALFVRSRGARVRLAPQQLGGGQERGLRSGTLNVPGIVGLGAAARLAVATMDEERARLAGLRDRLLAALREGLDQVHVNGTLEHRLAGNLNVSFAHVEGESLMLALRGIAVSSGSACSSATLEPSYVLRALGVRDELAHASIRFGLGRSNTAAEIDRAAERIVSEVKRLRKFSPFYKPAPPVVAGAQPGNA